MKRYAEIYFEQSNASIHNSKQSSFLYLSKLFKIKYHTNPGFA